MKSLLARDTPTPAHTMSTAVQQGVGLGVRHDGTVFAFGEAFGGGHGWQRWLVVECPKNSAAPRNGAGVVFFVEVGLFLVLNRPKARSIVMPTTSH
ncbi:hypothetical protein Lepto7375DRAFT_7413 [Leptolyngbya sp. PCC 7375]|nr:hypothetical protein Lepto7375DRAFT_7413 [Leptolyngbya sp. PCC 7375]